MVHFLTSHLELLHNLLEERRDRAESLAAFNSSAARRSLTTAEAAAAAAAPSMKGIFALHQSAKQSYSTLLCNKEQKDEQDCCDKGISFQTVAHWADWARHQYLVMVQRIFLLSLITNSLPPEQKYTDIQEWRADGGSSNLTPRDTIS